MKPIEEDVLPETLRNPPTLAALDLAIAKLGHEQRDITHAIEQQLAWYFGYAETATRLGNLTLLPSYVIVAAAGESEEEQRRRALALAATVLVTLGELRPRQAAVLRAVFTPRRWPLALARKFGPVTAVVVRLACAANPWPMGGSKDGLEQAAAKQLVRLIAHDEERVHVRALRKTARSLMRRALKAYVSARAKRVVT